MRASGPDRVRHREPSGLWYHSRETRGPRGAGRVASCRRVSPLPRRHQLRPWRKHFLTSWVLARLQPVNPPTDTSAIVIELLHDDATLPRRATEGSAGYDLFAYVRGQSIACSDGAQLWQLSASNDGGTSSVELPPGVT